MIIDPQISNKEIMAVAARRLLELSWALDTLSVVQTPNTSEELLAKIDEIDTATAMLRKVAEDMKVMEQ